MMVLVTGGSGSGKSAYAEDMVLSFGDARRIYIATMQAFDPESRRRIDRHRRMRAGKGFETVERYTDLDELFLSSDSVVLLECMSNLVANEVFREGADAALVADHVIKGVEHVKKQVRHVLIVTNEIFSDGFPYDSETKAYQQVLGEINCRLGEMADQVTEVVYGIPVHHKGGESCEKSLEQC